jgi:hypothetical protein
MLNLNHWPTMLPALVHCFNLLLKLSLDKFAVGATAAKFPVAAIIDQNAFGAVTSKFSLLVYQSQSLPQRRSIY